MAPAKQKYDWAQAIVSLVSSPSTDLNELAAAADLDPARGDLSDIDFSDLDLSGQNLSGWDLRNANFANASVRGTDFRDTAVDPWALVEATNWDSAVLDEQTREVLSAFNQALFTAISRMNLGRRTTDALRRAGVRLVGDLIQLTDAEMLSIPNCGRKSLNDIKEILAAMGLHLGMEIPHWRKGEALNA